MSRWTFMNIKGQGNSLTFSQGHSDSTVSNFFCSETARPIEAEFHMDPPWDEENVQMFPVTWPCPYMVKTSKSSPSEPRGRWPWNLVYSIGYSSTTIIFRTWPWVELDHFYDMIKFVSDCFCMDESLHSIGCWCISKFVLIQHILSIQVSDTGPMVTWCIWPL